MDNMANFRVSKVKDRDLNQFLGDFKGKKDNV